MAWETRGGTRYYYRKKRHGHKVKSVYVGGGVTGILAEKEDQAARHEREKARRSLASLIEDRRRSDLADLNLRARLEKELEAAGYLRWAQC